MQDAILGKIVSMIIQNLRLGDHPKLIELLKSSEYSLEGKYWDNWNGGVGYSALVFYLQFNDYLEIYERKEIYQDIILQILNKFYDSENEVIDEVKLSARIELCR